MSRRRMRSTLSVLLAIALSPAMTTARTGSPSEVYERLSKIPIHSDIEVKLLSGSRIRGELLAFDQKEVTISGQAAPIPLTSIRAVKRLRNSSGSRWNPVWGIGGSWKIAAVGAGIVLVLGIIAAKNTR